MKEIKSAVSVLLCAALLLSMLAIGTNAESVAAGGDEGDFVTTEDYSVSANLFICSGNAQLTAEYSDFIYDPLSQKTSGTETEIYIDNVRARRVKEYFENLGDALLFAVTSPIYVVPAMGLVWPLAPIVPFIFFGMVIYDLGRALFGISDKR